METKETLLSTQTQDTVLQDINYYKYIFKKTEKMACAVFYILRSKQNIGQKDSVAYDLEMSAMKLLTVVLESLKQSRTAIEGKANDLRYALIEFESKLRIANSARILDTEHLEVFLHEIDSVQRSLRTYVEPKVTDPFSGDNRMSVGARERKQNRPVSETRQLSETASNMSNTLSRRERVLNVLRDKIEATIKDIVEVVTDCSEKTIQRELISLIKDNIIVREGERRWSKYKLI